MFHGLTLESTAADVHHGLLEIDRPQPPDTDSPVEVAHYHSFLRKWSQANVAPIVPYADIQPIVEKMDIGWALDVLYDAETEAGLFLFPIEYNGEGRMAFMPDNPYGFILDSSDVFNMVAAEDFFWHEYVPSLRQFIKDR